MKKIFIFLILGYNISYAQFSEFKFSLGSSHFLGDLGGKKGIGSNDFSDIDFQTTRYALGVGYKYFFTEKIALRADITYARVSGDDKYSANEPRRIRNLSFFSPIIEGSSSIEFHPFNFNNGSLYAHIGIGYFYFDPTTEYNGKKVKLQPLGTEGQKYKNIPYYSKTSLSIPFGIGYRLNLQGDASFGVELSMRKTFTDYIDDASTTFPDYSLLTQSNGQLATDVSNRALPNNMGIGATGSTRALSKKNDNFFFVNVCYHMPLNGSGGGSSKGKYRRAKKGRWRVIDF